MLRGCIRDSPQVLGVGALVWIKPASYTKIDQLYITFRCHHDISWFEVTQNDGRIAGMDITQSLADLHHPVDNLLFIERPFRIFEHFFQAASRHKLHYKIVIATFLE